MQSIRLPLPARVCALVALGAVLAVVGHVGQANAAAAVRSSPRAALELRLGGRAAEIAMTARGIPYRWGGASRSGFDCSGLVYWAYSRLGIALPHNAAALYGVGRRIERRELHPGDLVFFEGLGHVGIYIGGNRMVHAPQSGERVEVTSLSGNYGRRLIGARRVARAL